MKRNFLLCLLFLSLSSLSALAQTVPMSPQYCPVPPVDSTLVRGEAAHNNLWPGFGMGSRRQADVDAATTFRLVDFAGVTLTGVGAIGVAATALQQGMRSNAVLSGRSYVPYYVFGGVALAGVVTLTTSRILAVKKARAYDAVVFPTAVPGGAGLAFNLTF